MKLKFSLFGISFSVLWYNIIITLILNTYFLSFLIKFYYRIYFNGFSAAFTNILMWVTFYVYGVRKYEIHNQSKVEETFFESLRKNMKISAKYPCTCKSTTKMIIILCTNQGTNKNIFVFFQRYLNILFIHVLVRYTCMYAPLYVVKCGLVCEIWQKKYLKVFH